MAEFLTPKQVGEILQVKSGTIYAWIKRGVDLPFFKSGGTVRIPKEKFERWCEARTQNKRIKNYQE